MNKIKVDSEKTSSISVFANLYFHERTNENSFRLSLAKLDAIFNKIRVNYWLQNVRKPSLKFQILFLASLRQWIEIDRRDEEITLLRVQVGEYVLRQVVGEHVQRIGGPIDGQIVGEDHRRVVLGRKNCKRNRNDLSRVYRALYFYNIKYEQDFAEFRCIRINRRGIKSRCQWTQWNVS